MELVFGTVATVSLTYIALEENSRITKIRILLPGTLSETLDFEKFRDCTSTVSNVVNLGGRSV